MKLNTLITITLLITNLSAWSICSDDKIYKGKRTYNLLMAGTGSNKNFLVGATCFQSATLSHLEETISIIQNPKKGPIVILESDSYKTMIKEAKNQCSVSMHSTPCKMYQVAIAIVKTAIKQQDGSKHSNTTSRKKNNLDKNIKLKILRNLPYAKRGYIFKSTALMKFYKSKKWYKKNLLYTAKQSDLTKREKEWLNRIKKFKLIDNETFLSEVNWYEEIYYHEIEKLPFEKKYAKKIFNYLKSKGISAEYLEKEPSHGTIYTWNDIFEMKDIDIKFNENPKILKILRKSSKMSIKFEEYSDGNSVILTFL